MLTAKNMEPKYLEHRYGDNYKILNDAFLLTHLGNLCKEKTTQPLFNQIIKELYAHLIKEVINQEFPRKVDTIRTRMANYSDKGFWTGEIIESETKTIIVDIARAGTLPGDVCFNTLTHLLNPELVRQDHLYMARKSNEQGQVIGVEWTGSKVGDTKDDSIVLIPDPMGATGSSISKAIDFYKKEIPGKAKKIISMNLIATPEFIAKLKANHPDTLVYALRLDRGASPAEILDTIPGTYWEKESGLTPNQYIIPGGGGFGELMNNCYC